MRNFFLLFLVISGCKDNSLTPTDPDVINITASMTETFFFHRWSPDGNYICAQDGWKTNRELWKFSPEGTSFERIIQLKNGETNLAFCDWSPDSKKILFYATRSVSNTSVSGLWTINLKDSVVEYINFLNKGVYHFIWSPKGNNIAYAYGNSIFIIPDTGGTPKEIMEILNMTDDPTLCWSPDGTELAIGIDDIVAVRISDNRLRKLVDRSVLEKKYPAYSWRLSHLKYPAWSPDGNTIAFNHTSSDDLDKDAIGIYLFSIKDSSVTRFTNGQNQCWSPDGKWIAFSYRPAGGDSNIYKKRVR